MRRRAVDESAFALRTQRYRPEKEHVPGSRPHWDLSGSPNRPSQRGPPGGAPGAAVLGHGVHDPDDVAQVGEASVAAGAGRRDPRWDHLPLRIGEIARVSFERRLADDWRRNGDIKTRREPGRCHRAWRDRWRAATLSQTLSRGRPTAPCKQDPLCLSLRGREPVPGDWAHGPVRGREPVPGGWANPGPRVSPLTGENKRGLPLHRRDPVPEGCKPLGPLRLSPS